MDDTALDRDEGGARSEPRGPAVPYATSAADGAAEGDGRAGAVAPVRTRARVVVSRLGRAALLLFTAYYLTAVLLLVVFRFVAPPTTGVQLQRQLEAFVAGRDYTPTRDFRSLDDVSRHAPRAVIAAEDGRFWSHGGFDVPEMRAAAGEALAGERFRGASTISQQLMKNLFGCACRNPIRKVYDVALTPMAELILGKDRILELYLNVVEWGDGVYGIEAAARHHYGVSADQLSRSQAAGLAALLPAPLHRTPANTATYRAAIQRRMSARGW